MKRIETILAIAAAALLALGACQKAPETTPVEPGSAALPQGPASAVPAPSEPAPPASAASR